MTESEKYCREFAKKHGITFERGSEVGFGRPAVGFTYGTSYIDYNPLNMSTWEPIAELEDDRLRAPVSVNSYHKSDCLCVLVEDDEYDRAIDQLAVWVKHLEGLGQVEIVDYKTGAKGMQAMVSGTKGKAVRIVERPTVQPEWSFLHYDHGAVECRKCGADESYGEGALHDIRAAIRRHLHNLDCSYEPRKTS